MNTIQVTKCKWCNEPLFTPGVTRQPRSDKQFCSASHRAKWSRWLKNMQKEYRTSITAARNLAKYLDHVEARELAATYLVEIDKAIKSDLNWHGVRVIK